MCVDQEHHSLMHGTHAQVRQGCINIPDSRNPQWSVFMTSMFDVLTARDPQQRPTAAQAAYLFSERGLQLQAQLQAQMQPF